jgi:hypothetical protein
LASFCPFLPGLISTLVIETEFITNELITTELMTLM